MSRRLVAHCVLALASVTAGAFFVGRASSSSEVTPRSYGEVDVGFAQDMSVHHAQAVAMADIVAANPDTAIRGLAQTIKASQLEEIGRMQGALALWGQPSLPDRPPMRWMFKPRDAGPNDPHHDTPDTGHAATDIRPRATSMPGMASEQQMQTLRSQTGRRQARTLLLMMRRHHQGGIAMAQFATRHAENVAIRTLAAKMAFEQERENAILARLSTRYVSHPTALSP